jgi:prepilin-type N-terminal cleavage/methylation domain-containing protein
MSVQRSAYQSTSTSSQAEPSLRRGFSLVELLLVLSLMVVLTSLTLPGVLRWQNGVGMERALSLLQVQLQETRLCAIKTGESWKLVLPQNGRPGQRLQNAMSTMLDKRHEFNWPAGISCLNTETQTSEIAIICHPDGTVTACTLLFKDAHGQQTMLQIDRLTGATSIVSSCRSCLPGRTSQLAATRLHGEPHGLPSTISNMRRVDFVTPCRLPFTAQPEAPAFVLAGASGWAVNNQTQQPACSERVPSC